MHLHCASVNSYANIAAVIIKKAACACMKMPPKKYIIFAVLIVVVAGAGIVAAVLLNRYQASLEQQINEGSPEIIPSKQSPVEKKSEDAMKQAFEGDVEGGAAALDEAIASTTDSTEKYTFYSRKATLLYNSQDVPGALEAALKAYEYKKSSDSAALVGQLSKESGSIPQSIEYYKKAVQLIEKADIYADEDVKYYGNIIKQLEGGAANG
jgi:hypothetical protein